MQTGMQRMKKKLDTTTLKGVTGGTFGRGWGGGGKGHGNGHGGGKSGRC